MYDILDSIINNASFCSYDSAKSRGVVSLDCSLPCVDTIRCLVTSAETLTYLTELPNESESKTS